MEYLILNEESVPFKTKAACKKNLPVFFKIIVLAFKNRITAVRVSDTFDRGWYNLPIADNYFLRDWMTEQKKDYATRLKTLISKTDNPQIPKDELGLSEEFKLTDYYLKGNKKLRTPSLGAAYLSNQSSLSFNSAEFWNSYLIEIIQERLKANAKIENINCSIKNIANLEHWNDFFKDLERQKKNSCRKGQDLWKKRHDEFPNLIFCQSIKKQFENLSINNATFSRLWDNLKLLNDFILNSKNTNTLIKNCNLNISDESDSVKSNRKFSRYREFTLPNGDKFFFGLHIKNFPGAYRLHIFPDYQNKKIYIGYFGKHLPTKLF